jgi:deoxyribodipyrimidine photo-lyase
MTSVMWFRRDLRVASNAALEAAAARGPVVPLFVLDPALLASSGGPRLSFLRSSLAALDEALGGALVVRVGRPSEVVPAVAAECGASAVFVARDHTPYGRTRDRAVSEALTAGGATLRGVGSPYAVAPGTVVKPDGTPYAVFTPFWKTWRRLLSEGAVGITRATTAAGVPEFVKLGSSTVEWPAHTNTTASLPAAGESAAWERWGWFREHGLATYSDLRNTPSVDGTSQLSTYLRWGVLHPAQLIDECDGSASAEAFVRELCWREFYADVLHHRPDSAWKNLDPRFDRMQVDTDAAALERFELWKQGRTGFGIVDAGMRQLEATGWMHNRVRMITASFLVKDLHLPWQWGARHFMDRLVDGDIASNNHGWQWVAGCGTDAAPYHRILNPTLQGERFDPAGEYVQQWVPEWPLLGPPMVDHGVERAEALRRRAALSVA